MAEYLVEQTEKGEVQRETDAFNRLVAFREKIEARYGIYNGNLVTETRAEREQEIEENLTNQK